VLAGIIFTKLGLGGTRQKKTPGGALSTRESELEKLRDKHPIIGKVIDYRELQKLLSTYIDALPPLLDKDSRLHSTFVQAGTTTGRIASINPNLQNIPIRSDLGKAIRHAFIAEKGFKIISLDNSQVELRIAAILSMDKKLIEIFKSGTDIHTGVASRVFKVEPSEVTREQRAQAKTINFGILYGMGVNALRANLGTDRETAQNFYNEYFSTFRDLAEYLDNTKAEAEKTGYTETLFGRKRYFAGFKSPLPFVRAQAERMAINAPIQGTSADMIKISMKKIDDYLKEKGIEENVRLVLQIHDELVYEAKEDLAEDVAQELKKLMEEAMPKDLSREVPIVAEYHIGDNWGETK
jgi:DNA polymerase I